MTTADYRLVVGAKAIRGLGFGWIGSRQKIYYLVGLGRGKRQNGLLQLASGGGSGTAMIGRSVAANVWCGGVWLQSDALGRHISF